jgi:predicted KAP-like P-loop ATPase
VRIINALSVTLKPLLGEVNIVDFIALEFLRIFTPSAYRAIKENEKKFVGKSSRDPERNDREVEGRFHDEWLSEVPREQQDAVRNVIKRLFPRLQSVWSNVVFDASEVRKWSAEARASAPDHYPKYFEFSVPENTLSRAELRAVISLGANADALESRWRSAMDERREDGETKADDLIDALVERDDLPPDFARGCLAAIFRVADAFLAEPANRRQGFSAAQPYIRLYWLTNHLVGRLPDDTRENDFLELVRASSSVTWLGHLATSIETMHRPDAERRDSRFQSFSAAAVTEIVQLALTRIRDAAQRRTLLLDPDLVFFLHRWIEWGDAEEVRAWVRAIMNNDTELVLLLKRIIRVSTVQNMSDAFARQVESIDPNDLHKFIDASAPEFISRITALGARADLAADERKAISLFEQGVKRASERSEAS